MDDILVRGAGNSCFDRRRFQGKFKQFSKGKQESQAEGIVKDN